MSEEGKPPNHYVTGSKVHYASMTSEACRSHCDLYPDCIGVASNAAYHAGENGYLTGDTCFLYFAEGTMASGPQKVGDNPFPFKVVTGNSGKTIVGTLNEYHLSAANKCFKKVRPGASSRCAASSETTSPSEQAAWLGSCGVAPTSFPSLPTTVAGLGPGKESAVTLVDAPSMVGAPLHTAVWSWDEAKQAFCAPVCGDAATMMRDGTPCGTCQLLGELKPAHVMKTYSVMQRGKSMCRKLCKRNGASMYSFRKMGYTTSTNYYKIMYNPATETQCRCGKPGEKSFPKSVASTVPVPEYTQQAARQGALLKPCAGVFHHWCTETISDDFDEEVQSYTLATKTATSAATPTLTSLGGFAGKNMLHHLRMDPVSARYPAPDTSVAVSFTSATPVTVYLDLYLGEAGHLSGGIRSWLLAPGSGWEKQDGMTGVSLDGLYDYGQYGVPGCRLAGYDAIGDRAGCLKYSELVGTSMYDTHTPDWGYGCKLFYYGNDARVDYNGDPTAGAFKDYWTNVCVARGGGPVYAKTFPPGTVNLPGAAADDDGNAGTMPLIFVERSTDALAARHAETRPLPVPMHHQLHTASTDVAGVCGGLQKGDVLRFVGQACGGGDGGSIEWKELSTTGTSHRETLSY